MNPGRLPCSLAPSQHSPSTPWAARPTPTMTDIGVASPSAQGHAIIRTVVALTIANANAGSGPKFNQARALTTAIIITVGTK